MHLFNTLIEKKEHYVIDLFYEFTFEFGFNEDEADINKTTKNFILKTKNEIQENLDQLNETQKYIYLTQLKEVFSKELPNLDNFLHKHGFESIVKTEFPENNEFDSNILQAKLDQFNNKYKYVEIDITNKSLHLKESFPYLKYWHSVKSEIQSFASFALDNLNSKKATHNNKTSPSGFKRFLPSDKIESLYHQFSHNPYRPVLVALDMLLSEIDEITDSKDLITFIAKYVDNRSNLNMLEKLVNRIDINDPETQLFFNSIIDALTNYSGFKFLPDDYTEIRDFFNDAYSSLNVLLLNAIKRKYITLEEFKEIRQNSTASLLDILNIANKEPELFELLKEHLKLLYRNVILDTCIFPLDPVMNGTFKYDSVKSVSLFPGKERSLLTIKENIFGKCAKKQEPDEVWLSRFSNDNLKVPPVFPNGKGVGRKGDEFTEAKIMQAALIDILKNKLKETGCIGKASKSYFITKWGIDKYDTFITNRSKKESFAKAKNQFQSLLQ